MNAFRLALASVSAKPLSSFLCILTAAFGTALVSALLIFSGGLSDGFSKNAKGIDIVVGAKGSPLQLVLSSVYHLDIPNGNISKDLYASLQRDPSIRKMIPLALGDNYKGFRIVGTTPDYIGLYNGSIRSGQMFTKPFEVVAGASVGLPLGAEFAGTHGFAAEGTDKHDAHLYRIVGILKPTGTVVDRLLLTSVDSVQELHAGHDHEHHHHHENAGDKAEGDEEHAGEVTAVLLKLKSPLSVPTYPRRVNAEGAMMAAAPSYEIARLARNVGIGGDVLIVGGMLFIGLSALMLLSSLIASLSLRSHDLAVLRVLGASRTKLFTTIMAEGAILSGTGAVIGIVAGHMIAACIASSGLFGAFLPSISWAGFGISDALLASSVLTLGCVAAMIPAMLAARTDIAAVIARAKG